MADGPFPRMRSRMSETSTESRVFSGLSVSRIFPLHPLWKGRARARARAAPRARRASSAPRATMAPAKTKTTRLTATAVRGPVRAPSIHVPAVARVSPACMRRKRQDHFLQVDEVVEQVEDLGVRVHRRQRRAHQGDSKESIAHQRLVARRAGDGGGDDAQHDGDADRKDREPQHPLGGGAIPLAADVGTVEEGEVCPLEERQDRQPSGEDPVIERAAAQRDRPGGSDDAKGRGRASQQHAGHESRAENGQHVSPGHPLDLRPGEGEADGGIGESDQEGGPGGR